MKKPLANIEEASSTKEKIMLETAILFAHRGYKDVTIKDIAKRVGIGPSAIYHHYEKKEDIFADILENVKALYMNFFSRTDHKIEKATCFKDILDSLFAELMDIYQIFIYYGVSLIACEQFRDANARDIFNNTYMKKGIEYSETLFNASIEKGWVKPFNAKALAMFFMNSVYAGSIMTTHTDMKNEPAYDPKEMFGLIYDYILNSVEIIE